MEMKTERSRHHWNVRHVQQPLKYVGIQAPRQTSRLVYELNEALDCCRRLPGRIAMFKSGLLSVEGDARAAHEEANNVIAEIKHLRDHLSYVSRTLGRIRTRTRQLPPLDELSDEEYGVLAADKALQEFVAITGWTPSEASRATESGSRRNVIAEGKTRRAQSQEKRAKRKVSKAKRVSKRD